MKNRISKNFPVPLNSLSRVKIAKSSLARGHIGGGGWVGLGWVVARTRGGSPRPVCPSLTGTTGSYPGCLVSQPSRLLTTPEPHQGAGGREMPPCLCVSAARGGGGDWGTRSWDPRPPPWVRGSIYKKKVLPDPGPNTHTAATIRKQVLTPPPQKKGTQVRGGGGYGGLNPKNHRGISFGPKMMILQGVRRQKPYNGVCYANDPQKGGYTTLAPALDLTTSLRGDFSQGLKHNLLSGRGSAFSGLLATSPGAPGPHTTPRSHVPGSKGRWG